MAVDPLLVGVWSFDTKPDSRYEYTADGKYLVYDNQPFSINTAVSPEVLTLGPEVFNRIMGESGVGVLGVWSNAVEEVYFKPNNTYSWYFYSEPLQPSIGEYSVRGATHSGSIETRELRAIVMTSGNNITEEPPFGVSERGTFVFSNNNNTVTINSNLSGQTIYHRVVPA